MPFNKFRESLTIIFVMTAFPVFWSLKIFPKKSPTSFSRKRIQLALLLLAANTAIVSCSGLLREARLLFLPYLLLIPLIGGAIKESVLLFKKKWRIIPNYIYMLFFIFSISFAFGWYHTTSPTIGFIFKSYVCVYTFTFALAIYLSFFEDHESTTSV